MTEKSSNHDRVKHFLDVCRNLATGRKFSYEDYEEAWADVMSIPELIRSYPSWIPACRFGSQYWAFISTESSTHEGRRQFLRKQRSTILNDAEAGSQKPVDRALEPMLKICNSDSVLDSWNRIHQRIESDPEGAITTSRALLESTCKHILDELSIDYAGDDDLNKLYKKTSGSLNLSPSIHKEQIFKQILSGCGTVINGFAALRNEFGDAHGKGRGYVKPSRRHADLAVNLSGTICTFLIETFETNKR